MLILVDQDGVIADFEAAFLQIWRARHPELPYVEIADRNTFYVKDQYPSEYRHHATRIQNEEGFYRSLPVVAGAREALEEMMAAGHEVRICTSPLTSNPTCASEKQAWMAEHFGLAWLKRMVITSDKTLVNGGDGPSLLVDDKPRIKGLLAPSWTHVVFDAPYNQTAPGPRLRGWSSWRDDLSPLLAA